MNKVLVLGIVALNYIAGNAAQAADSSNAKHMGTAEYQLQKDHFVEAKTTKVKPPMQSEQYFETKRTLKYHPSSIPGAGLAGSSGMSSGSGE